MIVPTRTSRSKPEIRIPTIHSRPSGRLFFCACRVCCQDAGVSASVGGWSSGCGVICKHKSSLSGGGCECVCQVCCQDQVVIAPVGGWSSGGSHFSRHIRCTAVQYDRRAAAPPRCMTAVPLHPRTPRSPKRCTVSYQRFPLDIEISVVLLHRYTDFLQQSPLVIDASAVPYFQKLLLIIDASAVPYFQKLLLIIVTSAVPYFQKRLLIIIITSP